MSLEWPERVLVFIPAYNEEHSIRRVILEVRDSVPHADILVVDDGSADNTAAVARAAGVMVVRHPINLCIGGTMQTGMKFALRNDYNLVLRLDGDGQHDSAELPSLYAAMIAQQADAVFGSRFLAQEIKMRIPLSRRIGISTFAGLVSLITRQRATDTTSGFCCLNRRAVTALARYLPQDYPEVEGRIILFKAGLKTVEVPANMRARMAGVSSIDNWRSVYYALKVSVAVVISALKDIPVLPQELAHDSLSTAHRRHPLQPVAVVGDGAPDPEA